MTWLHVAYVKWRNNLSQKKEQDIERFLIEALGLLQDGRPFADVKAVAAKYVREQKLSPDDIAALAANGDVGRLKDDFPRVGAYLKQADRQRRALLPALLTNLANMRHEMLKSIANNLRG